MKKFLFLIALAIITAAANAETWTIGERADITKLKAGDVIAMKNVSHYLENPYTGADALPNGASALWFGCYHTMASNNWSGAAKDFTYGMFPSIKDKSAFKLVEGPGVDGKATFYLQEMTSGLYIALPRETNFTINMVATTDEATDFAFEKNTHTNNGGELLVHYENGSGWYFIPLNAYGFMNYSPATDIDGWNFYYVSKSKDSFVRGDQIDETEVKDGMRILMQNPTNYNRPLSLGEQYLDNHVIGSDAINYARIPEAPVPNGGDYLYFSHGYSETNVWVLEASGEEKPDANHSKYFYLKNEASGEYLTGNAESISDNKNNDNVSTTPNKEEALTFTFGSASEVLYENHVMTNAKSVSLKSKEGKYLGAAHNYGYAVYGWGDAGMYNIYKVADSEFTIGATGYSTYVNDKALIVPNDIEVYGVTGIEGDELQLTQLSGETLAAGEPVIIKGEAGKSFFWYCAEDEGSEIEGNLLEGTGTEGKAVAEDEAYVLYNNEGTAVFRRAAAMTLPAYKAYLPASVIGGAQSNMFNLGNNITGIANAEAVTPGAAGATYYDMQGRRVSAPQKGQLYIVNGKKVIY